jgi:hypothetical protein
MKAVAYISFVAFAAIAALASPVVAQQPTPQVYRMIIQADAAFGQKCVDIPYGSQSVGVRLQLWDCNNGASQTFTYEQATRRLKSGNRCVVSWGHGLAGDPVGIDDCDFMPNQRSQSWTVANDGDAYKLIGANGLCLDIRGGFKEIGTPLNVFTCNGTVSQKFVLVQAN